MKQKGGGHKMHYLIKWKGYPTSDNSWEPVENVQAKDLIKEYKEEQRRQDKGKARNL
jgi:chromobox protein 3